MWWFYLQKSGTALWVIFAGGVAEAAEAGSVHENREAAAVESVVVHEAAVRIGQEARHIGTGGAELRWQHFAVWVFLRMGESCMSSMHINGLVWAMQCIKY